MWDFLRNKWPYGYIHINGYLDIILTECLLAPTNKREKTYSFDTMLLRMGVCKKDLSHVRATFELAFYTCLAVEVRAHGSAPTHFEYYRCAAREAIDAVLEANPVIHKWLHPPTEFCISLRDITKVRSGNSLDDFIRG